MGWVPDAPAVVVLALAVACALFLVEVALPTFGLAGASGLALAALGLAVLVETGDPWWPLLLVVLAMCTWAAVLLTWVPTRLGQVVAATAFGLGGVLYGVLAGDAATVVVGIVGALVLPLGFRRLLAASDRLLGLAPQLGMESLVDRRATVVRWSGTTGTVRLDGSLWSARSAGPLAAGAEVVVIATAGMTVEVIQPATSLP